MLSFAVNGVPDSSRAAGASHERVLLEASGLHAHAGCTTFRLTSSGPGGATERHEVTSPLLGTHNVENLLAALAVGLGLGLPLEALLAGVGRLSGTRSRLEPVPLRSPLTIARKPPSSSARSRNTRRPSRISPA